MPYSPLAAKQIINISQRTPVPQADNPADNLLAPQTHAELFNHVREAHKLEAIEDYVELIDDLISATGEARLVDIAHRMGITQPTASKTIARLQREGYVTSEPYRSVFLTEVGKQLADQSRARHAVVYQFLLALGLDESTARRDSEGMEHHVSDATLEVFQRYINSTTHSLTDN